MTLGDYLWKITRILIFSLLAIGCLHGIFYTDKEWLQLAFFVGFVGNGFRASNILNEKK